MKEILIIIIFMFIFSCKDEGKATEEEVILSINHIYTLGECKDSSYCKFEFRIDKDSIYTKKSAISQSINLSDIKKSYLNSDFKIDSLTNLIDFKNVKNESYITDCNIVDEGCYELNISTNIREIYVKYGQLPEEFLNLENFLRLKRMDYEF